MVDAVGAKLIGLATFDGFGRLFFDMAATAFVWSFFASHPLFVAVSATGMENLFCFLQVRVAEVFVVAAIAL